MTEEELLRLIAMKMVFAIACGTVVGVEREMNNAHAGFKTQILICVGSMMFTLIPQLLSTTKGVSPDTVARIIAQIVSGVGFLGAGAILHNVDKQVIGLTTAAWIWFMAGMGILIGLEHGPVALLTTISLVGVISVARKVEQRIFPKHGRRQTDKPVEKYKIAS